MRVLETTRDLARDRSVWPKELLFSGQGPTMGSFSKASSLVWGEGSVAKMLTAFAKDPGSVP